ncbi:E3 ubiquitin-protein ligase listerin [Anticarsia gemmatalis]|uniref:E3 ubiquitin-protein ligase listerin n=1 Tax=Anticarsia gemmatalis TaxID=129554 RepID=UPI003F75AA18
MGGKTKQSQRTKNNARPSSSSRSAELLSNSVVFDGGLKTVSSGKVLPALFPTLATVNLEQGLSPEYQICIKKLNKKDPITRTKALQELCELVNNGNVDDVVATLPSWAHFYKTLTADTDRKVREMTQVCHGAIVRVCGRRMAPHLKALLPSWLQAQYDEHGPAQTNAQNSLKSTFPDSKLPEVISFCKAEVMAHLLDNLMGNTEAIVTKKIENPEERELVLSRITTSSLRGLEYFTPELPPAHHDWLWEQLAPLLDANAYWKFATHNAQQVRAAWFGAMGRILERYKCQFGDKYGLRTMRVVLNAARDTNSMVAAQVWTCLLQFMHHIEDWHKYLEKKELLVKRILDVLETGGWGDARNLLTMLLPLLAHLPKEILTKEFYETFFNAVYNGLDKKSILSSKSERQTWITSLAECLRYLSIQQDDFVVEVATGVHRTWLEKVLASHHDTQTRNNLIKCSATNMTSLVKYWLKQSKEEHSEKYDQLLRNYWQNIGATVLTQIDKCGTGLDEIEQLIDGHILLLQTLKTTFWQETKKQQSIKFDGDEQSTPEKSPSATAQIDESISERYKHNLDELAHRVCSQYFEMAEKKQVSNAILTPLITVLVEFNGKGLYTAIARQFDVDSPYKLYDKVLRVWLTGDTMRCKAVVDIVFMMMEYCSKEEQDCIFDSFKQFTPAVVEWCLSRCVSHPYIGSASGGAWLRSAVAAAALGALAQRAAARGDARAAGLLLVCLGDGPDGEPLSSASGVTAAVVTVKAALREARGESREGAGALGARLVTALATSDHAAHTQHFAELVFELFKLNILVPRGDSTISVETWCEIRSSWQDGVAALADDARKLFLKQAAELLHEQLFQQIETLDIKKIEHIVSLCPHLFNRSLGDDSDLPSDVTEIIKFTQQLYNMADDEALAVETCALRHDCVTSQLNCLYDDDNDAIKNVVATAADQELKEPTKLDLTRYMNKYLFRSIYLRTLLLHRVTEDDDDEEEVSEQKTWCDALLSNNYLRQEFCHILYRYVILSSLYEGYAYLPYFDVIEQAKLKMDTLLTDVIAATSQSLRHTIVTSLSEVAAARGYYWSFAHSWYKVNATSERDVCDDFNTLNLEEIISGNGFFHSLQASSKYSSDPELSYKTSYVVMLRSWYVAHAYFDPEPFVSDLAACRDTCDPDVIVNDYYRNRRTMLYELDITKSSWSHVVSNAAAVEFMWRRIKSRGWDMPPQHWDFATISLCSLLISLDRSKQIWGSTKVAMLTQSVLRLLGEVREFVSGLRAECLRREPPRHVANLMLEWTEMFAPESTEHVLSITTHVLDSCKTKWLSCPQARVLSSLISVVPRLQWELLTTPRAQRDLSLARLAVCGLAALERATHPAHKYLAYYLMQTIAKHLVLQDGESVTYEPLWRGRYVCDLSLARLAVCGLAALERATHPAHKYLAYYLMQTIAKHLVLQDGDVCDLSLARLAVCGLAALERATHPAHKYLAYYLMQTIAKHLVLQDGDVCDLSLARLAVCGLAALERATHPAHKYLAYYLMQTIAKHLVLQDGDVCDLSLARLAVCGLAALERATHPAHKYLAYYLMQTIAKHLVLQDGDVCDLSLARLAVCGLAALERATHPAHKYLAYYLMQTIAKHLVLQDGDVCDLSLARLAVCGLAALERATHPAHKYLAYYLMQTIAKHLVLQDGDVCDLSLARLAVCGLAALERATHPAHKYLAYYLMQTIAKHLVLQDGDVCDLSLARLAVCGLAALERATHPAHKYLAYYLMQTIAKHLVLQDGDVCDLSLARLAVCGLAALERATHPAHKYLAYYLMQTIAKHLVLQDGDVCDLSLARLAVCGLAALERATHPAHKYLAYYLMQTIAKHLVLQDGDVCDLSLARLAVCGLAALERATHPAHKYLAYYLMQTIAKHLVLQDGDVCDLSLARLAVCGLAALERATHPAHKYLAYYLMQTIAKHLVLQDGDVCDLSLARLAVCGLAALERATHPAHKYLAYYLMQTIAKHLVLQDGSVVYATCRWRASPSAGWRRWSAPRTPRTSTSPTTSCRPSPSTWCCRTVSQLLMSLCGAVGSVCDLSLARLAVCGLAALERATHPAHKYLAYYLMQTIAKHLVLQDAHELGLWSSEEGADTDEVRPRPAFALDYCHAAFTTLHDIVDAALAHIVLGEETCELVSMSDSHSMALGLLLLADTIANLFSLTRGDLTQIYISIYRERQYAAALLTTALRLLPAALFAYGAEGGGHSPAPPAYADLFLAVQPFSMSAATKGSDISGAACRALYTTVCGAGCGAARGWWGAASGREPKLLERLVAAYVAPHAIREQLQNLHNRAAEIDDTEIRISWSVNEVVCVYNVEESFIELRVWLSRSHPLVPPRLSSPSLTGSASNTHWLALYLAYQNGTLLNALKMWTEAVSAKVEKSPQCYICYCRLHPSSGRLPRVPCHQCKNRFHDVCLRKWFATSNKSKCPLCRATF